VSAQSGIGWGWFVAWAAVGTLATFSFLTGLSIGILFLPLVVAGLVWVARRSPKGAERIGFAAGIGVMLLVVAFIQRDGDGIDPKPWLVAGLVLVVAAVLTYATRHRRQLR
jgi:hypothetical protein